VPGNDAAGRIWEGFCGGCRGWGEDCGWHFGLVWDVL
jgi:hypothetical protein